jgi:hypothetical protein
VHHVTRRLNKSFILLKNIATHSKKKSEFKFKYIIREEQFGNIGEHDGDS